MDIGTGDGRFVLRSAEREPERLWLGIDPVAANMAKTSAEAARNRPNAMFALASIELLPPELAGLASHITVNLPWGSLLRAVACPDVELLRGLADMARPGATLAVTYSASSRDATELARLGLANPDPVARGGQIAAAYAAAEFGINRIESLDRTRLRALGTTWAKRLSHDADRGAWRITAVRC